MSETYKKKTWDPKEECQDMSVSWALRWLRQKIAPPILSCAASTWLLWPGSQTTSETKNCAYFCIAVGTLVLSVCYFWWREARQTRLDKLEQCLQELEERWSTLTNNFADLTIRDDYEDMVGHPESTRVGPPEVERMRKAVLEALELLDALGLVLERARNQWLPFFFQERIKSLLKTDSVVVPEPKPFDDRLFGTEPAVAALRRTPQDAMDRISALWRLANQIRLAEAEQAGTEQHLITEDIPVPVFIKQVREGAR
jgi:hypothetical protein